jgi:cobalt-zinc-cadmium efflux system protein
MEGTPEGTDLEAVTADLRGQDGVLDVHHVHAWTLTSGKHAFSAHIRHGVPAEAADLLNRAYHRLTERYGFHMVTLQLETACLDERHARDLDVTLPESQRVSPDAADSHAAHADPLDSAAQDARLTDNS